ncbi:MAG: hypothetical protein J2P46_09950 [Zavarzinella sp.]|nr:hypothetical protein [Zavarzinella sp.]
MCRIVLIIVLVFLILLMAGAALVVQEYGWPGFLAFLAVLVVVAFVLRKGLPFLFGHLLTRPLRQMGAALRGARIVVHSVSPCEPPRDEWDEDSDDQDDTASDGRRIADRPDRDDEDEDEPDDGEDEDDESPVGPLAWYQIELTVVPPDAGSSEGRMVTRQAWTPPLVGAVGPRPPLRGSNPFRGWPPAEQFPGSVQSVGTEVWTGSAYEPPGESVFGEQRLRLTVGVTRDVRAVTITYAHFTDIGEVPLPRIDLPSDRHS